MKLCKVSWPSAAESRDGLVESCTCRCRHRGGSPSHPGHDPPVGSDPTPRLDHGGGPRAAYTLSQRVPYLLIAKRNSICTLARARVCIVKTAAPPPARCTEEQVECFNTKQHKSAVPDVFSRGICVVGFPVCFALDEAQKRSSLLPQVASNLVHS